MVVFRVGLWELEVYLYVGGYIFYVGFVRISYSKVFCFWGYIVEFVVWRFGEVVMGFSGREKWKYDSNLIVFFVFILVV